MNITGCKTFILIGLVMGAGGCGDSSGKTTPDPSTNDNVSSQDHVWKEQTDVLDKAKNLENVLEEAQAERVKQLDDETP